MRTASIALATLALAAAACGGSSHSQTTTAFAAAADRTCADQQQRLTALGPGLINADIVSADHLPRAAAYLDKVVDIRSSGLSELDPLAADPTAPAAAKSFMQAIRTVIGDYHTAAVAAHNGDLTGFRAAFDRVAPGGYPTGPDAQALNTTVSALSLKTCEKADTL